jgi:hypothetical protein
MLESESDRLALLQALGEPLLLAGEGPFWGVLEQDDRVHALGFGPGVSLREATATFRVSDVGRLLPDGGAGDPTGWADIVIETESGTRWRVGRPPERDTSGCVILEVALL